MTRSKQSSQKREKEKNKKIKRTAKEKKRLERKQQATGKEETDVLLSFEIQAVTATQAVPVQRADTDAERSGRVVYLNPQKNYGFIRDQEVRENLFFDLSDTGLVLKLNDAVHFKKVKGQRGNTAVGVRTAG